MTTAIIIGIALTVIIAVIVAVKVRRPQKEVTELEWWAQRRSGTKCGWVLLQGDGVSEEDASDIKD